MLVKYTVSKIYLTYGVMKSEYRQISAMILINRITLV